MSCTTGSGLQRKKSRSGGTDSGPDTCAGAQTTTDHRTSEGSRGDIEAPIPRKTRVLTTGGTLANTQNVKGADATPNAE